MKPLHLDELKSAHHRIRNYILETPLLQSFRLQKILQWEAPVFLKVETLQFTGSFKVRGAANKILKLVEESKKPAHIVASSAGNHAQAVAYIAQALGIPATIVMPEGAPLVKVKSTEEYGAKVVLHGAIYDQAYEKAQSLLQEIPSSVFVHPYQDLDVVAGQGTLGIEIIEQLKEKAIDPNTADIVIPVGGGGQFGGVASAFKELCPGARCFGVVADAAPAMALSFKAGKIILGESRTRTLAEGLSIKKPSEEMLEIIKALAVDVAIVNDADIARAIFMLIEKLKLVAEGAGAASLAGILSGQVKADKKRPLVLSLCGGNIDLPRLSTIIERGLHQESRWLRLEIRIEDKPGELSKVTHILGGERANVLEVIHDRLSLDCDPGQTLLRILIETRGAEHANQVLAALHKENYSVRIEES